MSANVRAIRKAILGTKGTRNADLKTALEAISLTAAVTADPNAFRKIQKIILNSGRDDEVQLRRALNGLNLTGNSSGAREVHRMRHAILRTGSSAEFRSAVDDLISL